MFIFPLVVLAAFLYSRRSSPADKAAIKAAPAKELKTAPEKRAEVSAAPLPEEKNPAAGGAAVQPEGLKAEYGRSEFTGRKGRIVNAYRERLRALGQGRQAMTPQTTLREYLQSLEGQVDGETLKTLTELTRLAEMAMYSPEEPGPEIVEKAERLGKQ